MGIGAVAEPLVVISLLAGGTLANRDTSTTLSARRGRGDWQKLESVPPSPPRHSMAGDRFDVDGDEDEEQRAGMLRGSFEDHHSSNGSSSSATLLEAGGEDEGGEGRWRPRTIKFWKLQRTVMTPNTRVFENRLLSRVLRRFPFLVEAWYWALIYWVYQIARAISAVLIIDKSTVDIARHHALQLIHVEQALHLFIELPIQKWFMSHPFIMHWTNRIYSFIHIPGSILFLVVFYYITTTRPRRQATSSHASKQQRAEGLDRLSPELYEQRRRTMATCNLIAFVIFTAWPCMPPRLLSEPTYTGPDAAEAKSFGFVDTVHGKDGSSSVWTTNRFANQYAAMPSLHFGYSLLIGLTVATLPLDVRGRYNWRRTALIMGGMTYPAIILAAIISTANHFVLDAIAGACVVALAWHTSGVMLNLLPLEDYFLTLVRIHKPSKRVVDLKGLQMD